MNERIKQTEAPYSPENIKKAHALLAKEYRYFRDQETPEQRAIRQHDRATAALEIAKYFGFKDPFLDDEHHIAEAWHNEDEGQDHSVTLAGYRDRPFIMSTPLKNPDGSISLNIAFVERDKEKGSKLTIPIILDSQGNLVIGNKQGEGFSAKICTFDKGNLTGSLFAGADEKILIAKHHPDQEDRSQGTDPTVISRPELQNVTVLGNIPSFPPRDLQYDKYLTPPEYKWHWRQMIDDMVHGESINTPLTELLAKYK